MKAEAANRMLIVVIAVFSMGLLVGCVGMENAPKNRPGYLQYHKPLPEADWALDEARNAGKDKKCPREFNEAKAMVDKAYEVYMACRTQEAIGIANDASVKIKALCPQKPIAEMKPETAVTATTEKKAETKSVEKAIIEIKILFDTNKADIKKKYIPEVNKVAEVLKKNPDATVEIQGHTDSVGNDKYNLNLSQRRADSVRNYLIKKLGINPSRVTAKGYGKSQPIADNKTKEGKQKNRRTIAVFSVGKE